VDSLFEFLKRYEKYTKNADLMVAVGLVGILMVMIIPLPSFILDLALTLSITMGLLILLVALYVNSPLEFSVFPSLLLITTLFRLSLNVASTRLILSNGHEGEGAAGEVITAFGQFVVGDNYAIGLIVFVILVVINFVVITKGSGRIAEVAARFTLDALPGKQMSIDADLNAGLINEEQARTRRKEIEGEADFYGSMDGASKFVRGDAIAGIIITVINIIGGLFLGVIQKGLDIGQAAEFYTKLTIGDGLVSQIPALIISTAAGIVVTRNHSKNNIGDDIASQLLLNPRAIWLSAGIIFVLGLVPGLPTMPFVFVAAGLGGVAWMTGRYKTEEDEAEAQRKSEESAKPKKENIENLLPLDLIELEVGYGLISTVESEESGDLLERIVSIRKQFALDLGVLIPSVHIRDNLQLQPGEYRLLVKGNKVAQGVLKPDCFMAMDPGNVSDSIEGIPTKEPAFGLDALWITKLQKENAEIAGYTVVDLPTIIATHLTEVLRQYAHEIFGRQEANRLVENFKKSNPKVVEELIPDVLSLGQVVKVLQNLLREQVSIRDLLTIFETLADEGTRIKDTDVLTEQVRKALARSISHRLKDEDEKIQVINLGAQVEDMITQSLLQTEQGIQLAMDPVYGQALVNAIAEKIENHPEIAGQPILLTSPMSRRHIFKLINRFIPQLCVLSHSEVSPEISVEAVGTVEDIHAS